MKLNLEQLDNRDVPSVVVWDMGRYRDYEDVEVVFADYNGGPRIQVWDSETGQELLNEFVFESGFRGGIRVDYYRDVLRVGPGWGGGPVEVEYRRVDNTFVEQWRVFRDEPHNRLGYVPNLSALIPFEQHSEYPLTDHYVLDAYERALNLVPRQIQQQLLDAGLRIIVHSAPNLGYDFDEVPLRNYFDPGSNIIYLGYGAPVVHEIGHGVDMLLGARLATEEAAFAFERSIYVL